MPCWLLFVYLFSRLLTLVDWDKKAKVFRMSVWECLIKEQLITVNTLESGVQIQFYEWRYIKHLSLNFIFKCNNYLEEFIKHSP